MNDLKRNLAPLTNEAWSLIEEEASDTLKTMLAGRKIADFTGPLGWITSAVGTGRTEPISKSSDKEVNAALRKVLPLVELRVPFTLQLSEMDSVARSLKDPDLDPVKHAARAIALAEDRAIFHGYSDARIEGICELSADAAVTISVDYQGYPGAVATALEKLRINGVTGPYAIALGPRSYKALSQTFSPGGYPLMKHVKNQIDGPMIWAPAVEGAVIVSLRGGDFELIVGRDLSIGYQSHSETEVRLYLEESFTFRALAPEAAVPLVYDKKEDEKNQKG